MYLKDVRKSIGGKQDYIKEYKKWNKKVVANSTRKEAEKKLTKLQEKPKSISKTKFMKKYGKGIEEGKWVKGKDQKLTLKIKTEKVFRKIILRKS